MRRVSMLRRAQAGVTLIEASISLAVLAVIVTSAAPSFAEAMRKRRIEGVAGQVRADLQYARVASVVRNERLRISFFDTAAGTGYVLHSGDSDQCTAGDDGRVQCQEPAVALKTMWVSARDAIRVEGSASPMLFDPVHGTVSQAGTVKVVGDGNRAIHHVVNVLGRVRSCSPQAAMPGYKACP